LCINQRDFDLEGIPTSRVFEIPASSAVMIAGDNALIKHLFEDRVLYVTSSSTPYEMFGQVQEHIRWVRDHPEEAAEKTREAHRFFNEQLSLEVFLQNIVQHYEEKFGTGYATGQMPYPKECVETVILP